MEKRVLLTVGACAAILMLYNYFILPVLVPSAPPVAPSAVSARQSTLPGSLKTVTERVETSAHSTALATDKKVFIDTDLYHITLSSRGAVITNFTLKKYTDAQGNELQLISLPSVTNQFYPLRVEFQDKDLSDRVNNGLFTADKDVVTVTGNNLTESVTFTYIDKNNLKIEKKISFNRDSYALEIAVKVSNLGTISQDAGYYINWGYNLGREFKPGDHAYSYVGPASMIEGELVHEELADLELSEQTYPGAVSWAALQDNYFAAILVPRTRSMQVRVRKSGTDLGVIGVASSATALSAQTSRTEHFTLYGGPKIIKELKKLGCQADKIIDYGWFGSVAKPMTVFLNLIYSVVGNYGIAIILLTMFIKVLFLPLTQTSFKSMKKMQGLQPKITAIRSKYKQDPTKMNTEIMDLYREHKVNPLGGCMPMVLQIPVFFALYKALLVSIELRHAPFIATLPFTDMAWLGDLSSKDPYYITPILMGISMVIQQRMTPSTGDPKQAKMMMLMPVVFTFMFLNFPCGLVIYWLVNNVLTITQQTLINKKVDK